jgi:3'-5' exoribonuclease
MSVHSNGSVAHAPSLLEQVPLDAPAKVFVRDLADGQQVESPFVVRACTQREKRSGEAFLKLRLGDVTGAVDAVVWDGVEDALRVASSGAVVVAAGRYSVDTRYGACLTIRSLAAALEGSYDPSDLHEAPPIPLDELIARLRELIDTIQDPHLRILLDRLLSDDAPAWPRYRDAPAAKYYHQAYRHGLLEHCLSVAQGVNAMSATFPGIDRDVAVVGALLHDIGKIDAYDTAGDAIELSDAGKLHGEIALGYYRIRREIDAIGDFPPETAQALLHIVLSHHGQLEHGSPVVPCTREATLVHMIDNLGGRLGSFDRIEKGLSDGERWSSFDRALSGAAYFGRRAA